MSLRPTERHSETEARAPCFWFVGSRESVFLSRPALQETRGEVFHADHQKIGLGAGRHTFARSCSHGMRKKTSFAMALLPGPEALFLDEGHLIRKNLREMMSTLDFCCGALIAVATLAWCVAGMLPAAAFFPLTAVAMLTISTCALTLFGLDGAGGMTRYRLMPLRGWQVLLAKDAAYMTMALVLAMPLSIGGACAGALVALAFGHNASVRNLRPQLRWRFQTGPSLGDALVQVLLMVAAGAAVVYSSPLFLLVCVAAWAGSLWWFGREIDRTWH